MSLVDSKIISQLAFFVLIFLLSPTSSEAVFDDSDQLSLPGTGPNIDFHRVKILTVSTGADAHIFELPKRFPKVENITIADNSTNEKYLKDLSENYSDLKKLAIIQTRLVGDKQRDLLRRFNALIGLNLDCPFETLDNLSAVLPLSLEEVLVSPNSNITSSNSSLVLPHVRKLSFISVELSSEFMRKLDCSELVVLSCLNCTVENNAFSNFALLPRLKKIQITRTKLCVNDLQSISKNRIRLSGNPNAEAQTPLIPPATPHLREVPAEKGSGSTYTLTH